MFIIGVTGPSGAGKGTFSGILVQEYGFEHIDTDQIAKETVPEVLDQLVAYFGPQILTPEKQLDRKSLAKEAFSTPQNTQALNRITHPAILNKIQSRLEQAKEDKKVGVVIDGAALIEANVLAWCHTSVAVIAERSTRLQRIINRDQISIENAEIRLNGQKPDEYYIDKTAFTIYNNKKEELEKQTQTLMRQLGFQKISKGV